MPSPALTLAPRRHDWRSIVALNAVSVLSQIGQFGLAFTLLPLALEAIGRPAWQVGGAGAAMWAGMLVGLLAAPRGVARFGHRATVIAGLGASSAALLAMPALPWYCWPPLGAVIGLGLGLRWIANETWLYSLTPDDARGRVVGVHETLIGIAAVAGPALIAMLGARGWPPFALAAGITSAAALPLFVALPLPTAGGPAASPVRRPSRAPDPWARRLRRLVTLGSLIAGLGGAIEGALLGVFPVFAAARGVDTAGTAWLLSAFGLGSMLLQFPLGWFTDHRGLRPAATLCALGSALFAALTLWPGLGRYGFALDMFLLGGAVSGFLTLGMIAATQAAKGAMADEVSRVSIAFTACSALGPLVAGALASAVGASALMVFATAMALLLAALVRPPRAAA